MFVLSRLEQNFRVLPRDLSKPRLEAISMVIDRELLDKVIHTIGLCVTLYDIVDIQSGEVYPNDGGIWFTVIFRIVIFRPFFGEIVVGKIRKETSEGLQLSLGFFDDVFIPEHFLPEPSFYDEEEGVWFWNYTNDEGETNQMYMEANDDVRFKVTSVRFNVAPSQDQIKATRETDPEFGTEEKPFAPMQVFGEISTTGLGPLAWWRPCDEGDDRVSVES